MRLCGRPDAVVTAKLNHTGLEIKGRLSKLATPRSQVDLVFCDSQSLGASIACRHCKTSIVSSKPPQPLDVPLDSGNENTICAAFFYNRYTNDPIYDTDGVLRLYHSQCALDIMIRCEANNTAIVSKKNTTETFGVLTVASPSQVVARNC